VIGALYGDRRSRSPIGEIEATLVEMLARGVAAGLARLGQERAALAARIMFEQFFTPELARQLEIKPDLMKGRDLEVTVLSVHVPGFGRFCERLGPARTAEWVRDMLDTFSQCVLDQHGVVVDLAGHELMALWGAPQEQADQAELACRAAQSVLASLPELNARWKDAVGEAIDAAIGVDTGVARVGHIGSTRRFKYGPLGDTVFVARRVQEATRYLKCHLIVTGPTRARLSPEFQARHLCTARIAGVANPVPLWQLGAAGQDEFQAIRERYERSLEAFEGGHFQDAIRILGEVLSERPDDGPSQLLMSRALGGIVQAREPFQTLWELPNS
jgi:adenylate cyclase